MPSWRRPKNIRGKIIGAGASVQPVSDVFQGIQTPILVVTGDPSGTPDANRLYKGLIPKAWAHYDQTADSLLDSENVSGKADDGTGVFTISWDRDFSGADACAFGTLSSQDGGSGVAVLMLNVAPVVGSAQFRVRSGAGTSIDRDDNMIVASGRQA